MTKRPCLYTFLWKDGDFELVNEKKSSLSNEIILYIDEESQYMRLTSPSPTQRILYTQLQKKLQFIQKRGFWIESLSQRIGEGYDFHIDLEIDDSDQKSLETSRKHLSSDALDQENEAIKSLEMILKTIKNIWMHKRTFEGIDSMNQEKYGEPEKYIQFRASDFEKLDIKIRNLPESIINLRFSKDS